MQLLKRFVARQKAQEVTKYLVALLLLCLVSSIAYGQSTYTWVQNTKTELEKGVKNNVDISDSGEIFLHPLVTTASDSVGTSQGTIYGAAWASGKIGSALKFDGVWAPGGGDYARFTNVPVNTASGAQNTVEFWMYWKGIGTQVLLNWTNDTYRLLFHEGCFGFNTHDGLFGISSSGLANRWVHVAAVFVNGVPSSSTVALYLDGVKQNISACAPNTSFDNRSVSSTLDFGSSGATFGGVVDEIAVYNRALTDAEVSEHALSEAHYPETTTWLAAYWKLDDAQVAPSGEYFSQVFADSSGSASSNWVKIIWKEGVPSGTKLELQTRTGNTANPDDGTWSAWSDTYTDASGSQIISPPAIFIQWRAKFTSTAQADTTPFLSEIKIEYSPDSLQQVNANDVVTDWHPAFSPGGTKIAFNQGNDIYIRDLTSSNPPVLFQTNALHPTWSPDGTQVAFIQDRFVYKKNLDGTGLEQIIFTEGLWTTVTWSPSGRYFALSGTGSISLFSNPAYGPSINYWGYSVAGNDAAWSPDERWVVYEQAGRLVVRPVDSNGDTLPDNLGTAYLVGSGPRFFTHPWFLPDSKHIVFTSCRSDLLESTDCEIYVKNIDSNNDGIPDAEGALEQVTVTSQAIQDVTASWTQSGVKLAYASTKDGGDYDIFILDYVPGSSSIQTNPPQTGTLLFEDTFSEPDGPASKWTPVYGTWAIENGEYGGGTESLVSNKTFSDFVVEAKVEIYSGSYGGLIFRSKDSGNRYVFSIFPSFSFTYLTKWANGSRIDYAAVGFSAIPVKESYTLKVLAFNDTIRGYVDGVLQFEYVESEQGNYGLGPGTGAVGLYGGIARFDDVRVYEAVSLPVEDLPVAYLTAPKNYEQTSGTIEIKGIVKDSVSSPLASWRLEYGLGENPVSFATLKEDTQVFPDEGVLLSWDTQELPTGVYTLRLTAVSQDGKQKVVTSLFSLMAGESQQVNANSVDDTHPVFFPDGTKLAYNQGNDIYIKELNSSNPPRLFQVSALHPSFSSDGKEMAYQDVASGCVKIKNLETGQVVQSIQVCGDSASNPILSPSGNWIAMGKNGISVVNRKTGYVAMLFSGNDPAWSPDERWIAASFSGNIVMQEFISTSDGHATAGKTYYVQKTGGQGVAANAERYLHPWFLPDSKHIVFTSSHVDAFGSTDYEIYVKNIDGNNDGIPDEGGTLEQVTLTSQAIQDITASWVTSGVKFAYASTKDGGDYDIFVQDYVPGSSLIQTNSWVTGNLLFEDTFSEPDGPASKWAPILGTWAIENGEYSQSTVDYPEKYSFMSNKTFTDFVFESKVNIKVSTPPNYTEFGALAFRVQDANNMYLLRLRPSFGLDLFKIVSGQWKLLTAASLGVPAGAWHNLKVEVFGNTIRAYVDQTLIIFVVEDATFTSGKAGLIAQGHVHFDDVRINEFVLPPQEDLPVAYLTAPKNYDEISGAIEIKGVVNGSVSSPLASWRLEYGQGDHPNTWTTLKENTEEVPNESSLFTWDMQGLLGGVYTLRLTAFSQDGKQKTVTTLLSLTVEQNQQVSINNLSDTHPIFSPDGTKIAYNQGSDIYIKDVSGSLPPVLFQSNAQHPVWSADGTQIAFIYLSQVSKKNLDGTGFVSYFDKLNNWSSITWSPTGKYFALLSGGKNVSVILNPVFDSGQLSNCFPDFYDPSRTICVLNSGFQSFWGNSVTGNDPAWSPDERWLVYERDGNIYLRALDGNGNGIPDSTGPEYIIYDKGNAYHPWFVPDGSRIVFHSTQKDALGSVDNDIWLKAIDGDFDGEPDTLGQEENITQTNQIIHDITASWIPTSALKLAFSSSRDGGDYDIFLMDYVPSLQPALPIDAPVISITSSGPGITGRFGKFGVALNEVLQTLTTSVEKLVQTTHPVSALGKLTAKSVLGSSRGQTIATSPLASFYITDSPLVLTLETDKAQYKVGETVTIAVEAKNVGTTTESDVPLKVLAEDATLLSNTLSLSPGDTKNFTVTFTPQKTFTLSGTLKTFEIAQTVAVIQPKLNPAVVWNMPEQAGQSPFETTLIVNNENLVDITVNFVMKGENGITVLERQNEAFKAGETRLYRATTTITKDTLFTLDFTGDATHHFEKPVTFEEKVSIVFHPESVYPEGALSVPFTVANTGRLDSSFDLHIAVGSETFTRLLYVPAGQTVFDALPLFLSSGDYTLHYSAFFGQGNVSLVVRGQNQAVVSSVTFSPLTEPAQQTLSAFVKVKNTSWSSFDGNLLVDAGFFTDDVSLSLAKSEEKEFLFFLPVPLQSGSYPVTVSAFTQGTLVTERTENLIIPEPTFSVVGFTENVTLVAGGSGDVSVNVKNTGVVEGTAKVILRATDIHSEEKSVTLQPGEEAFVTYTLTVPNDYPTGNYAAVATVQGTETDISFSVSGMKVSVTATLDKDAYTLGENAQVTFRIDNLSQVDSVPAFVRVQFNGFDEKQPVTLTKDTPVTVSFSVPVVEGLDAKLFYGVYQEDGGRSLLLNTLYIPLKGDVVTLTTDKQVYNIGDTVTVTVNAEEAGSLKAQYYGQESTLTFDAAGTQTFSFTVPPVRAGTYLVFYDFTQTDQTTVDGSRNFDVAGFQVKVSEVVLDKPAYKPQDTVKVTLRFDSNSTFSGKIKGFLFDPNGDFKSVFETDKNVVKGLNRFDASFSLATPYAGLYQFIYGIFVKEPEIFLTSGSEAFEVEGAVVLSLTTDKESYTDTEPVTAIFTTFGNAKGILTLYMDGQPVFAEEKTFSGIQEFTQDLGLQVPGSHTLKVDITSSASSSKEISFDVEDTQPPTAVMDLQSVRIPLTRVQLTWSGVTDNAAVVRYKVLRMENEPITDMNKLLATILTNTLPSNTRTYLDTATQPGRTYYYSVTSFDAAGNESALSNSPFVEIPSLSSDTVAPVISNVSPPDGISLNTTLPAISATIADDNLGVDPNQISVKINDVPVPSLYDTITQKLAVSLLPTQALTEGVNTLIITAADYVGNSATSQTSFTVDITRPVISVTNPQNGSFVTTKPLTVTVALTDNVSGIDLNTTVLKADGITYPYSFDPETKTLTYLWPEITDGQHEVVIEAKDKAGNLSDAKSAFTVKIADTTPPVISNVVPADGVFVSTTKPVLSANITDDHSGVNPKKVFVKSDDQLMLSTFDPFTQTVVVSLMQDQVFKEGTHSLKITAVDNVGNTATSQTTFVVDITAPVISILYPLNDSFVKATPFTVMARLIDNVSGIDPATTVFKADGMEAPYTFDPVSGLLTYSWVTSTTDGMHELAIDVKDRAGNASIQAKSVFTMDMSPPQIVNVSDTQNPISVGKNFSISGTVVDTNLDVWKLTLTDTQNATVQSTSGAINDISYTWNGTNQTGAGVADGQYTYSIVAKDKSGNVTEGAQLVEQTILQDNFDAESIDTAKWTVANEDPGLSITQTNGALQIHGQATQFGASPIGNGVLARAVANSSNNFTLSFDVDLSSSVVLPGASVSANVVIGHPGLGTTALLQFYYHPGDVNPYEIRFSGQSLFVSSPVGRATLSYRVFDNKLTLLFNNEKKAEAVIPFMDGVFSFLAGSGGPQDIVDVRYDNFVFTQEILTGSSVSGKVVVDSTPPTATLEIVGTQYAAGGNLFISGNTQLTIQGNDPVVNGVSAGVEKTQYAVDQEQTPQIYMAPFTLMEGPHTVRYSATDNAGNESAQTQTQLVVDATKPVTNISPAPQAFTKNKTFTLSANDPQNFGMSSGVKEIRYRLDGVDTIYAGGITLNDGYHILEYFAVDNVGNEEQHHSVTFTVDTTKPEVTNISDMPDPFSPGASAGVKDTNTISANVNDANPDTWQLKLFDAANTPVQTFSGSGSFIAQLWNGSLSSSGVASDGLYSYSLLATDKAGNTNKEEGGSGTTTTLLQDDFNTGTLDTAKWSTQMLPSDPGLSVAVENGQLRIFGSPQTQNTGDAVTGVMGLTQGDAGKKLSVSVDVDVSHSQVPQNNQPVLSLVLLGNPDADALITMNVVVENGAYMLMYQTFSGQQGMLGNIPAQGTVRLSYTPSPSSVEIFFNNEQKAQVPLNISGAALTVLAATGALGSFVDVRFDNFVFSEEGGGNGSGSNVQTSDTFDDGVIDTNTWDTQNFRGHNWYTLEEKEGTLVFSGSGDTFDPEFVATKQTVSSQKDFVLSVQLDLSESVAAGGGSMSQTPVTGPVAAVGVGNSLKFYASALSQQPTQTYRLYAFSPELGFVTLTDLPTGAGLMVFSYTAQTQKLSVVFNGTHQTDLTTTFNEEPLVALLGAAKDPGDTLKVKFDNFSLTQGSGNGGGEGAPTVPDGFIMVDNTLPVSMLTPSAALFNNQFASTSTTYAISANDPVVNAVNSGIEKIEVAKDNETFTTYTSALSLDEGKHTLKHKATDNAGNTEDEKTFSVDVDGTSPVSTHTPSAALFSNVYAPISTTYALSANDPVVKEVSSGVMKTIYKVDNGELIQYSSAISLTEGEHTVTYFSKDNVLNVEADKTFTVKVDNTAPVTQVVPIAPLFANQYAPITTTYTLTATDPQSFSVASGVSKIEYTLDGGVVNTFNGNAISLTEGVHTFVFYATDNVGNVEQQKTFTVHVDNTPAVTTASAGEPKFSAADKQYVSANTPITLNATDPTVANVSSGVASTQYKIDGGNYIAYSGAFTLTEGIHTVAFRSTDNVGNVESEKTQIYHVDATSPTAQISFNATNCTDNGKTVVSAQTLFTLTANDPVVSDVSSGVKELRFRVNSGAWQTYAAAFTLTGLAQDGEVTIELIALDNVENTSAAQSITVILDATPPVAQILSPQDKSVVNNTIAVMGTVTDAHFTNSSYTVAFGSGQNPTNFTTLVPNTTQNTCTAQSATCEPLTYWNTNVLTQNTLYTLKLTANDCVGNMATTQALLRIGTPEFALSFGTHSGGNNANDGEFNQPTGLVAFLDNAQERVLVSDKLNDRLQSFDNAGTFVVKFTDSLKKPTELAVDAAQNIYIVDSQNDRIVKTDKNFTVLASIGTHGAALGQFNKPYGIALDSSGNIYVTDKENNRIQKLDANGNALKEWTGVTRLVNNQPEAFAFSAPSGIAVDTQGNVYVSDSANNRILKFSQDGTLLYLYDATGTTQAPVPQDSTPLATPLGLHFDNFGNLYVADSKNDRVQKFDPWGNRLLNFGTQGAGNNPPDGTFHETSDMTLDTTAKFVYVTDVHNHRVQKFAVVIDAPVVAKLASTKNDDKNAIISDPNLLNVLKVVPYPTPSRGKLSFNLEAEGNVTGITLEVYTINGKRVLTEFLPVMAGTGAKGKGKYKAESPSLDAVLSSLPNGVYVYRLQISNGVKTVNKTGKFVVVK